MESDNETCNLEDLRMFLNSVLEKAELIYREENVDLSTVETGQCITKTADCRQLCRLRTRGNMQTEDKRQTAH